MHITPEAAGLIAQVFPTLLIALLIEGRGAQWTVRWLAVANHYVRFAAVLSSTTATFFCLIAAVNKQESVAVDVVVTVSVFILWMAFALMIGHHLGLDRQGLFEPDPRKR